MLKIKKSKERGYNKMGWLESYHSFSFANYYDPTNMNYAHLRVINDDKIEGYNGFGAHPHKDMEIITFMLSGEIEHKDNMGNVGRLTAGNAQLMRAGTGVVHSEMNPSSETAHLLQIWVMPSERNLTPGWWEKSFTSQSAIETIVEPVAQTASLPQLNSNLSGRGLQMAQNGYILKIGRPNKDTDVDAVVETLDFERFGLSSVYFHQATGQSQIQVGESKDSQMLLTGDAAQGTLGQKVKISTEKDSILLVFVFPKA